MTQRIFRAGPPAVQCGPGAMKAFQAVCITDWQGPVGDHMWGDRCWIPSGSQDRARMMIDNQFRQDGLTGITARPLNWAYVPEQVHAERPKWTMNRASGESSDK